MAFTAHLSNDETGATRTIYAMTFEDLDKLRDGKILAMGEKEGHMIVLCAGPTTEELKLTLAKEFPGSMDTQLPNA